MHLHATTGISLLCYQQLMQHYTWLKGYATGIIDTHLIEAFRIVIMLAENRRCVLIRCVLEGDSSGSITSNRSNYARHIAVRIADALHFRLGYTARHLPVARTEECVASCMHRRCTRTTDQANTLHFHAHIHGMEYNAC